MYIAVDGDECTIDPCVDSNDAYIIYDGAEFSASSDAEVPAIGEDIVRQLYAGSQYGFVSGVLRTVTPPVGVPIWIGVY